MRIKLDKNLATVPLPTQSATAPPPFSTGGAGPAHVQQYHRGWRCRVG